MKAPSFRANLAWKQSAIGEQLSSQSHEWLETWFAHQEDPPTLLYHYTTVEGLLGILKSNTLWATHVGYLNDATELTYAHNVIQGALQARMGKVTDTIELQLLERIRGAITPTNNGDNYFVTCFCEVSDLLSQWRAYGTRGGGYAMGFESRWLQLVADPTTVLALRRVIYDPVVQRTLVNDLLSRAVSILECLITEHDAETCIGHIPSVISFLRDHFAELYFTFKDPAFEEEKEWRLVFMTGRLTRDDLFHLLEFRAQNGIPIPYVSLGIHATAGTSVGKLPLAELMCGPVVGAGGMHAVRWLLEKARYTFVETKSSTVPLRF